MSEADCELLPWDTRHFSTRVARVLGHRLDAGRADRIDAWCRAEAIACLYFQADGEDLATARLAARRGYEAVDTSVVYVRQAPAAPEGFPLPAGFRVRPGEAADLPALEDLAAASYGESRFWYDERFAPEPVREMYRLWVRNAVASGRDQLLTLEYGGAPAGFIIARPTEAGAGTLTLAAIAPGARGRGLGLGLYSAALAWLAERGAHTVHGTTQVRNVKVQRLLQRLGFLLESVKVWHHKWYEPAAVRAA